MRPKHGIHLLLFAAAALMLAFPARIYECDAVIYASAALHGGAALSADAGHLGFGLLEYAAASAGRLSDPPLGPIALLRYLSLAAALCGIYIFYRVIVAAGAGRATACWLAAALGFSYGYWHYALQAESHALSAFLLILFLGEMALLLSRDERSHGPSTNRPRVTTRAALWLGLATLMHQKNILLFPFAAMFIGAAGGGRWKALMRFTSVYAAAVLLPYLVTGWFIRGLRTYGGYRDWILGLSVWGGWGAWRATSLPTALVGFARSVAGSHYLLGFGPVESIAARLFPGASLQDELAVAGALPAWGRITLLPLHAAAAAAGITLVARGAAALIRGAVRRASLELFLCCWLAVFALFSAWWAPERAEFWMDLVPPLLLAVALSAVGRTSGEDHSRGHHARFLLPAFVLTLALVNLFGSIRPQSRPDLEPETRAAVSIDAALGTGDILISDGMLEGRAARYASGFQRRDLLDVDDGMDARERLTAFIDSVLASSGDSRVYIAAEPLCTGDEAAARRYRRLVEIAGEEFELLPGPGLRAGPRLWLIEGRASP